MLSAKLQPLPLKYCSVSLIRRAEETQVCIWLACSKPIMIKAQIFLFDDLKSADLSENQG